MEFLKWVSENSCLSVVLLAIFMRGLVDTAKELRKMKIEFTKKEKDEGGNP